MKIIKKKTLDDLSKKIDRAEEHAKKIEEINLNAEEDEKLQRFEFYQAIRMVKYLRQGGDPTSGNLDATEQTSEEFEYYLSHCLNDYAPEERYKQRKEMYYFHSSYVEMEKLDHLEDRAAAKYCNGHQCIPAYPYYERNGKIEDEEFIEEFMDCIEILEIKDYKRELGEELVDSIVTQWNFH